MNESKLRRWYLKKQLSVAEIARKTGVSQNKINYWISKYKIPKRSISDATYLRYNPKGDPFIFKPPKTKDEWQLFGLGIGLFWGEGNKRNKNSIRLGNVDPRLIMAYMTFLNKIYGIDKDKLKFGLQIFSDISPVAAQRFWMNKLGVRKSQFQKIIITPSRGTGSYRNKNQYGVLTVYFNNTKLKKMFDSLIENFPSL
ncbi:MAG: helix-turn-helix transcriptional regulator [Minisyncoccia bacterium]